MTPAANSTPFTRTLIFGAGIVGGEIARNHLRAGLPIELIDIDRETLAACCQRLGEDARPVQSSAPRPVDEVLPGSADTHPPIAGWWIELHPKGAARPATSEGPLLVIESIVERLDVKQEFLSQLSQRLGTAAVLTSNTSSLRIADVFARATAPERSCGLHFFMPVTERPLVELVSLPQTAAEVLARVERHAAALGKPALHVADRPGFVVNRLLWPYLNNAVRLLELGAEAAQIEAAALRLGMPLSPLQLIDLIGLRTAFDAGRVAWQAFPDRIEPSPILPGLIKKKQLGVMCGAGFHAYQNGQRNAPELTPLATEVIARYQRAPRSWDDQEVYLNLCVPILLEAAAVLEELIVAESAQIQSALEGGLGFAAADSLFEQAGRIGAEEIRAAVQRYGEPIKAMRPGSPRILEKVLQWARAKPELLS